MAEPLPLLVFPRAKTMLPPKRQGFAPSVPHVPSHHRQIERLAPQLKKIQEDFSKYKANISPAVAGLEPETVLVIKIVGNVDNFKQAIEAAGLEWLGEWDIEGIEPDDDFYETNKGGRRVEKSLPGRLFLSLSNERGLKALLNLWQLWATNQDLPHGKTKWRDVFSQILEIRRWGFEETLGETGMFERWQHDLLDPINPAEEIYCQIELFYRQDLKRRKQNETAVINLLSEIGGKHLGSFIDMPEIAFHAVKAKLPADCVHQLLDLKGKTNISLFKFPGIMYFRPTGQSIAVSHDGAGETASFPQETPDLNGPPIVAILDGVPNLRHEALKDRLLFDDPDNLSAQYQPGERRHGTAMASLVVHGDRSNIQPIPLASQIYHAPVMQPNPTARDFGRREEYFPNEVFFEDRIARTVRRMFEGEGDVPAQAPGIKIINLSLGDPERPFLHTSSPWARLLDWLSWKYRVLFCVSAGNFNDSINIDISSAEFLKLADEEKAVYLLGQIAKQLSERRLLSPAESLNSLTIGALHTDESGDHIYDEQRIDLLPNDKLFSPISRFGHGFRRSIKPEIFFPGGRQLYQTPPSNTDQYYKLDTALRSPGQQVAWDSSQEGDHSRTIYTRGTSNATALATRSGARIYEVLAELQAEDGTPIQDNLMAVLIKTLLVHGAQHDNQAKEALEKSLKNPENSGRFKGIMARYLGYGAIDIDRVLACTEQRGTVLGCGEIEGNQVHEYHF